MQNNTTTPQWYISNFSGYNSENMLKIAEDLEKTLGEGTVFCPTCTEKTFNKKTQTYNHIVVPRYAGYIFIKSSNVSDSISKIDKKYSRYYFVTSPNANAYATITESEILTMKNLDTSPVYAMYREGDIVIINSGAFKNFNGSIVAANEDTKKVKVNVDVFNTVVTLDITFDDISLA